MHYQFICTKWGSKYPAADVNRLYRAVARVMKEPFRFFCVTDDGTGIEAPVEVLPIPDLPVIGNHVLNRGWRKLTLFSPALTQVQGPTLYLDLDMVIVDTLVPFFTDGHAFCVIKDYKRLRYRNHWSGNTSVFIYRAGYDYGVYRRLAELGDEVQQRYRNEQEFLSDVMRGQGELRYWPKSWCPSYKYHCVPPFPLSLWQTPRPPEGAKVIVFHGRPKPEEAVLGTGSKWYRPMKPAPWLAPYL